MKRGKVYAGLVLVSISFACFYISMWVMSHPFGREDLELPDGSITEITFITKEQMVFADVLLSLGLIPLLVGIGISIYGLISKAEYNEEKYGLLDGYVFSQGGGEFDPEEGPGTAARSRMEIEIDIEKRKKKGQCKTCWGSGECNECRGTGAVITGLMKKSECGHCAGSGKCSSCKGTGFQ